MPDNIAIKVEHVSKTFKLPHEKNSSIKSAVVRFYKRDKSYEEQHVLKDVSFEIKKGEFFGIVGRNGSGKSTLLKLLAGIYTPTEGAITLDGKLTPFIELGVGFNQELSGRENIFLNGALLGFGRSEMTAMYDDIVKFAELERFMDQKLKNYSSGMQVRLAFSIAIRAKSEILLIDEVLAVGDAAFQTKCFDYFQELRSKDVTVIFVSHDRASLERFCTRGILIDQGEIIKSGPIQGVLQEYSNIVLDELEGTQPVKTENNVKVKRSASARISNVRVVDNANKTLKKVLYGEPLKVLFEVNFNQVVVNPIVGITIWQKNVNKAIFASNTLIEGFKETGTFKKDDVLEFSIKLPKLLNDGEYSVEPAVANEAASVFLDQQPGAFTFTINGSENPHSILSDQKSIQLKQRH